MISYLLFLICLPLCQEVLGSADNPFRLPKAIIPYHYILEVFPNIYSRSVSEFFLSGKTEIFANVTEKTKVIKVHAVNLTIKGHIRVECNKTNIYASHKYEPEYQWFVLTLKKNLQPGDQVLIQFIRYERPIDHSLHGLYYYTRTNKKNDTWYGVTTQMQTIFARYVFPCFDEPGLKATFKIVIFRQKPKFSLSNGLLESTEEVQLQSGSMFRDTFKTTPKLPTYLVAMTVTEYEGVSETINNVNCTFYYPSSMEGKLGPAINTTKSVFPVLTKYFDVSYPTSKLDMIGFSKKDFKLGGMENLGLIMYQDFFFYSSAKKYHQYIAKLVTHELVHQWFGNLVSPQWWDDLWLNEGMTEFFSLMRGTLNKEYDPRSLAMRFVLRAMSSEIADIVSPVYVPWAKTPKEIEGMLNDVTYMKGGMIIKMAELIMGAKSFKKAMRKYMKENLFGSVRHNDLFETFSTVMKERGRTLNITAVLTPWITLPGFPLITVKIDYRTRELRYSQQLYVHSEEAVYRKFPEVPKVYNYTWPIPIQWTSGTRGRSDVYVEFEKSGSVTIPSNFTEKDWLVVNPEGNFYYIVNYEKEFWLNLGKHLAANHKAFHPLTRSKLVYDLTCLYIATKMGRGNFVDADTMVKVLDFVKVETDKLPLKFFAMLQKETKAKASKSAIHKTMAEELKPILDAYDKNSNTG